MEQCGKRDMVWRSGSMDDGEFKCPNLRALC